MKGAARRGPAVRARVQVRAAWWAATLALALASAAALADAPAREVGFVSSYRGDARDYRLWRAGRSLPVRALAPLYAGDRLEVLAEEGELRVQLATGGERAVTGGGPPLVLPDSGAEASVSTNVARWLGSWLEDGHAGEARVALASRGVDLEAPLLGAGPAWIGPGAQPLALAWQGGLPPFRLVLVDASGAEIGAAVTSDRRAVLAPAAGAQRLVLTDAAGARLARALRWAERAPAPPPALAVAEADARAALEGAWLASVDGGAWALEAYRRLVGGASGPAAARVAEALARGTRPAPWP